MYEKVFSIPYMLDLFDNRRFFAYVGFCGDIIYQEVTQPSARNGSKQKAEQQAHEYEYKSGVILPSPGHLKISVSDEAVVVDYIKPGQPESRSGTVVYSYKTGGSNTD